MSRHFSPARSETARGTTYSYLRFISSEKRIQSPAEKDTTSARTIVRISAKSGKKGKRERGTKLGDVSFAARTRPEVNLVRNERLGKGLGRINASTYEPWNRRRRARQRRIMGNSSERARKAVNRASRLAGRSLFSNCADILCPCHDYPLNKCSIPNSFPRGGGGGNAMGLIGSRYNRVSGARSRYVAHRNDA